MRKKKVQYHGKLNSEMEQKKILSLQSQPSHGANSFQNLNSLRYTGTKTDLDGTPLMLLSFSQDGALQLKHNYAFPSQLAISAHLFSNTLTLFDNTNVTFDDDTP